MLLISPKQSLLKLNLSYTLTVKPEVKLQALKNTPYCLRAVVVNMIRATNVVILPGGLICTNAFC